MRSSATERRAIPCRAYHVVDTNRYGLELLSKRVGPSEVVQLHARSVLAHFDVLRPGGIAIIAFPAPTLLYRAARTAIAAIGMWEYPNERPLKPTEVLAAASESNPRLSGQAPGPVSSS